MITQKQIKNIRFSNLAALTASTLNTPDIAYIVDQNAFYTKISGVNTKIGNILWTDVQGRPTLLSQFTNDINNITSLDSRNTNYTPIARDKGFYADFRDNTIGSLSDGGLYHGVLTFRKYGTSTDMTGGVVNQLALTDNGNLWIRTSNSNTTWGAYQKFWLLNSDGSATLPSTLSINAGTAANHAIRKDQLDALSSVYQPLENQRLSTSNAPTFNYVNSSIGYIASSNGISGFQIRNITGTGGLTISNYANSQEWMRITNTGNLLLGSVNDNTIDKLQITGNISSTGELKSGNVNTTTAGLKLYRTSGVTNSSYSVFLSSQNSPTINIGYGLTYTGERAGNVDFANGWYQIAVPSGNVMEFGRIAQASGTSFTSANQTPIFTPGSSGSTSHVNLTVTGDVKIGAANNYYVGNQIVLNASTSYTKIYRPDGAIGVFVGGTADPYTYNDNTGHYFRNIAGTTQVFINSSGIDMFGKKITGGIAATASTDFVIKSQLDAVSSNISGTTNYIPKFTGSNSIGNSTITVDNFGQINFGNTSFSNNIFTNTRFHHNFTTNMLYTANKRYTVTNTTGNNTAVLFNNDYDSGTYSFAASATEVININNPSTWVYPDGFLTISFYNTSGAETVTARMQDNTNAWYSITMSDISGNSTKNQWRGTMPSNNFIKNLEITVTAKSTEACQITEIAWYSNRLYGMESAIFNKYEPNSSYYNLNMKSGSTLTIESGSALTVSGTISVPNGVSASHAVNLSQLNSATTAAVSGTLNYLSKFTSTNVVGNSQVFDNGTGVGIGTSTLYSKLTINDVNNTYSTIIQANGGTSLLGIGNTNNRPVFQSFGSTAFNTYSDILLNPSGGNIVIGSNSGGARLNITSATGEVFRADAASGAYRIVADQSGVLMNGNVGIGVATALEKLHIVGTQRIVATNNYLNAYQAVAGDAQFQTWYTSVGVRRGFLGFAATNDNTFYIQNEASSNIALNALRVGINTVSPTEALTVNGRLDFNGNTTIGGTQFGLGYDATNNYGWMQTWGGKPLFINPLGNNVIFNRDGGSVGIGTTAPSQKFHIAGNMRFDGYLYGYQNRAIGGSDVGGAYFGGLGGTSSTLPTYIMADNSPIIFYNNGVERARIAPSGNFGIGVNSPNAKLHVNGSLIAKSQIYLQDGSGNQILRNTEIGARDVRLDAYNGTDFNGTLRLGAANLIFETGTTSVTERMKLDVNGNMFLSGNPASTRYIALNENASGTTQFIIQAGAGSSGFGGAINLFGHSHATRSGSVIVGISAAAGTAGTSTEGRFAVSSTATTQGGTDLFTVLRSGNTGVNSTNPIAQFEVFKTSTDGVIRQEVARFGTIGRSVIGGVNNRSSIISFYDANNPTLIGGIGGIRENPSGNYNGGVALYYNSTGGTNATSIDQLTEGLRLSSSGNIGIGTIPDSRLDVIGASSLSRLRIGYAGTGDNYIDGASLNIRTAATTPIAAFTSTGVVISNTNDEPLVLNKTSGSEWNYMAFKYAGTRRAFIGTNSGGNLQLSVEGTNKDIVLLPTGTGVVGVNNTRIVNLAAGTNSTDAVNKGQLDAVASTVSGTSGYIPRFNSSSSLTNSAIFWNGANFGFSTVSPLEKVHVASNLQSTGIAFESGTGTATLDGTSYILQKNLSGLNYRGGLLFQVQDYNGTAYYRKDAMYINYLGNVGIGTVTQSEQLSISKNGVSTLSLQNTSGTTKNNQILFRDNATVLFRLGTDVVTNNNTNNFQIYSEVLGQAVVSILGSSGAATFNSTVTVANGTAPSHAVNLSQLTGAIGSGTTNYISKYTSSTTQGNSIIYDNGSAIGIGTTSPNTRLEINNGSNATFLRTTSTGNTSGFDFGVGGSSDQNAYVFNRNNTPIIFGTNGVARAALSSTGNLSIGSTSDNGTDKLQVTGSVNISSNTIINGTATINSNIVMGGSSPFILYPASGVAAPTFTTRSVGTKIVLYPNITSANVDYALGIDGSTLWSSVPASGAQFKWYAGITNIAILQGTGALSITGGLTATTGTFSGTVSGSAATANTHFVIKSQLAYEQKVSDVEANVDNITSAGVQKIDHTGYSSMIRTSNVGGSTAITQEQFNYNGTNRFRVKVDGNTWTAWKYIVSTTTDQNSINGTLLHSNNYTSYSPSLTGTGASGIWGINVTGSAGSVAWANVSSKPTNIMYASVGNGLNNDNTYLNVRVLQNSNSTSQNDGLYIGYSNSNNGITRIYGGGASTGGITVLGSGLNDVAISGYTVFHQGNYSAINLSNMVTGTLPDARLSANVSLDNQDNNFSVNQTVPNASANGHALNRITADGRYMSITSNNIKSLDLRDNVLTPANISNGISMDFKTSTADGLSGVGTYHGIMSVRQYGTGTDFSGGQVHQLAFTDGGTIYKRVSTNSTTWGTWIPIIDQTAGDARYGQLSTTNTWANTNTFSVSTNLTVANINNGNYIALLNSDNTDAIRFKNGGTAGSGSGYLQVLSNLAERARMTWDGNWLLNTTTDNGAKLQVNGNTTIAGLTTTTTLSITGASTSTSNGYVWSSNGAGTVAVQAVSDLPISSYQAITVSAFTADIGGGVTRHLLTLDCSGQYLKVFKINLTSVSDADGVQITFSNMKSGGLYTIVYYNNAGLPLWYDSTAKQEDGSTNFSAGITFTGTAKHQFISNGTVAIKAY